jgi:hypothetical protein
LKKGKERAVMRSEPCGNYDGRRERKKQEWGVRREEAGKRRERKE